MDARRHDGRDLPDQPDPVDLVREGRGVDRLLGLEVGLDAGDVADGVELDEHQQQAGHHQRRDGERDQPREPNECGTRAGSTFPHGTLIVNLTGCFFLGLIGQFTLNRMVISPDWRMAIAIGFFGGYTTFSSFGWETAKMLEDGEWLRATTYVGASVIAGLLLSVAGIRLANRF